MKQIRAIIKSSMEIIPEIYLVWLDAPQIAAAAAPGQFVMVRCGGDTVLPRPLSIHRVEGDSLSLLFSVVGRGTRWLSQQEKGESLDLFGPLGNGFRIDPASKNLLIVSGGMGIAPLVFLADVAAGEGKKVTLITGARSADCLLPISSPQGLFDGGMHPASINVVNATDDGSEGFKGPATDLIPAYLEGVDRIYACGPLEMYRTMAQMPELKNKPVQLSLEIMMGCGMGVCYGCTIKTKQGLKQVCKDGPVFDMGDVVWEEFEGL
ncbi:MAG: dihydroorotate dehydrogenase electron transfer subunit [Dehalococcoidales bacterium]|nr:dihydroorotate dehydrogenase electron transfer subunit [Dehalococcoidales bacterium]